MNIGFSFTGRVMIHSQTEIHLIWRQDNLGKSYANFFCNKKFLFLATLSFMIQSQMKFLTNDFMCRQDVLFFSTISILDSFQTISGEILYTWNSGSSSKSILFPKWKSEKTGSTWQHREASFVA